MFVDRKVTVVGELNPYGANPRFALYDLPERASGHRLRTLVMQVRRTTYSRFHKLNLCTGRWRNCEARERAIEIGSAWTKDDAPIVLLGAKVAHAFGFGPGNMSFAPAPPFTEVRWPDDWPDEREGPGTRFVLLPHPSGLCRRWSEPGAFERAREVLRSSIPCVPWGETQQPVKEN